METVHDNVEGLFARMPRGGAFIDRLRWLAGLEATDRPNVAQHAAAVARTSSEIASELSMDREAVSEIHAAARWHDLGKLAVDAAILAKNGRPTDEEFAQIKGHAKAGFDLLGPDAPQAWLDVAHYHHERYDGFGYHGLKGEDIPLTARIVSVADVHDALVSKREYKKPMPEDDALVLMSSDEPSPGFGRRAFDPIVLRTFVAMRLADPSFEASDENRAALAAYAGSDPMSDLDGGMEANGGWRLKASGHRLRYESAGDGSPKRLAEMLDPAGREVAFGRAPAREREAAHEAPAPSRGM